MYVVLSHRISDPLLHQPQETNTETLTFCDHRSQRFSHLIFLTALKLRGPPLPPNASFYLLEGLFFKMV